jgi:hypothetical protein
VRSLEPESVLTPVLGLQSPRANGVAPDCGAYTCKASLGVAGHNGLSLINSALHRPAKRSGFHIQLRWGIPGETLKGVDRHLRHIDSERALPRILPELRQAD